MSDLVLTGLSFSTSVDVRNASVNDTFAAVTGPVGGVGGIIINFDKYVDIGNYASYTQESSVTLPPNNGPYGPNNSQITVPISAADYSKTVNITSVTVFSYTNSTTYTAADLTAMGINTSFNIVSNQLLDNTPPTFTDLTIPTVVIDDNGNTANNPVGVFFIDDGSGVDHAVVNVDKALDPSNRHSFTVTQSPFGSQTPAGTYNVTSIQLYDKAGNSTTVSASQLAAMNLQTSFLVANNHLATALVTAPSSVTEGSTASFNVYVTLKNVAEANGMMTMALLPGSADSSDVIVPSAPFTYHVLQSPAGNYTVVLPAITVINDANPEPDKTINIQITAPGQIFDNGTNTYVLSIPLHDDDGGNTGPVVSGTGGNDTLRDGASPITMVGGAGDDTYYVNNYGDVVVERPGEGNDLILSSISYDLPANVERITLTGSANINSAGNELDNVMIGRERLSRWWRGCGYDGRRHRQ
jgi:hypothetical protein